MNAKELHALLSGLRGQSIGQIHVKNSCIRGGSLSQTLRNWKLLDVYEMGTGNAGECFTFLLEHPDGKARRSYSSYQVIKINK